LRRDRRRREHEDEHGRPRGPHAPRRGGRRHGARGPRVPARPRAGGVRGQGARRRERPRQDRHRRDPLKAAGTPARRPGTERAGAGGLLRRAVDVRGDEVGALLLSFAYFFSLLCGYYVLRPIRDEMGISRGVDKLPVLFTGTFVAMAIASPLFGWLASRWARHRLISWAYHFFALDIVAFYALWKLGVGKGWVPYAFYIWAAVYNLFVTSVFWSFMTDVFTSEQGKRLFGFISAGGGLG